MKNISKLITFLLLLLPISSSAYNILFYYNHLDGTDGGMLACVTILQKAGNQVKVIDVAGQTHDPEMDSWENKYDQVWDFRFVYGEKERCGTGSAKSPAYFDEHWQSTAISYLNHCGNLFLVGEHYQLTDRNEGLYQFLNKILAVKEGYDSCPPSQRGNNTTNGPRFYNIQPGLGTELFYGDAVGGIPIPYLSGTNYVNTNEDWRGGDETNRSIVSGWSGSQLGGVITSPLTCHGKLFMVWDATMWSLWSPDVKGELKPRAPLDESSWFRWDSNDAERRDEVRRLLRAQKVTEAFFPAVARWLGSGHGCPCEESVNSPNAPINQVPVSNQVIDRPSTILGTEPVPAGKSELSVGPAPEAADTTNSRTSGIETLIFKTFPVNLYMRFLDGPGKYQLDIWKDGGGHLKTIYRNSIGVKKDDWATWDGSTENNGGVQPGVFWAVLSKEGKFLKKINLSWINH